MKRKSDIILWSIAILLLLAVTGYTVYSISFLADKIDTVLTPDIKQPLIKRFDFEKLDKVLSGKTFDK